MFEAPVPFDGWSPLWTGIARMAGQLPPAGQPHWPAGIVARGGVGAPGGGRPDGGLVRPLGERCDPFGPRFDGAVPANGYSWWYIDAESDDGQYGLTVIAFIGSVFSPYYKASGRFFAGKSRLAQRRALWPARPALGDDRARPGRAVARSFDAEDRPQPCPLGRQCADHRCRGKGRAAAAAGARQDPRSPRKCSASAASGSIRRGATSGQPLAPLARVDVAFADPDISWSGQGYLDSNHGSEPLEDGFADWQWSRAHLAGGETAVIYEGKLRSGDDFGMALRIGNDGNAEVCEMPGPIVLPRTNWRVDRLTRADTGHDARLRATWEDTPFYSRSALSSRMFGQNVVAVHESLSLDRFRSPVVQWMLPWRMPRKL